MSALIGRLLREGKVRRIPSEEDHRVTRVAITKQGREALLEKQRELKERVMSVFLPLTDDELERIDTCLVELNAIISQLRIEYHG
jgi:DNA-binding MarR family transcriptional regulator